MSDQFKKIQKQIFDQVDPTKDVGHVKIDKVQGYTFRDIKETGKRPTSKIIWKKRYYIKERELNDAGLCEMDRNAFNSYSDYINVQSIETDNGNIRDTDLPKYINANYAIKVYSRTAKTVPFTVDTNDGNFSIYLGVDITGTGTASGNVWTVSGDDPDWGTNDFDGYTFYDDHNHEFEITANTSNTITVTLGTGKYLNDGDFRIRDTGTAGEVSSTGGAFIYFGGTYYLELLANTWHTISFYYYSEIANQDITVTCDFDKYIDAFKGVDFEPPPAPQWNDTYLGTLSRSIGTTSKHLKVSSTGSAPTYGAVRLTTNTTTTPDMVYYESKTSTEFRYATDIDSSWIPTTKVWEGGIRTGYYDLSKGISYIRLRWKDPLVDDLGGISIYEVQYIDTGRTIYDQPTSTTIRIEADVRSEIRINDVLKIDGTHRTVDDTTYISPYTTVTLSSAFAGDITATVYKKNLIFVKDISKGEERYDIYPVEAGEEYIYVLRAFDSSEFKNKSTITEERSIIAGDRIPPSKPTDITYDITGGRVSLTWKQTLDTDPNDFAGFDIWAKGGAATYVKDVSLYSSTSRFTVYSTRGLKTDDPILVQYGTSSWETGTIVNVYGNDIEVSLDETPMVGGLVYQCVSTTITGVVYNSTSTYITLKDITDINPNSPLLLKFGQDTEETAQIWDISGNIVELKETPRNVPVIGDRVVVMELIARQTVPTPYLCVRSFSDDYAYTMGTHVLTTGFGTINKYWISSFDKVENENFTKLNSTSNIYYGVGTVQDWGTDNLISSFDEIDRDTYPYADEILLSVGQVFSNTNNEMISPIAVVDLTVEEQYKDMSGTFEVIHVKPSHWGTGTGSSQAYTTTTRHTPSSPTGNTNLTDAVIGCRLIDNDGDEFLITGRTGNNLTLLTGTPVSGDYDIIIATEDIH